MVYLDKNFKGIFPYFIKNAEKIQLYNSLTKKSFVFDLTITEVHNTYVVCLVEVGDEKLVNGIYDYTGKTSEGVIVNTGLLQIGDFAPETNSYKSDKEYKTYKL